MVPPVTSGVNRIMKMIANNIRIEPDIVKIKNLIVAYTRRVPPQIPIIKYIGINESSQKT